MGSNSTKTHAEPSRASLREMPEVDFTHARVLGRGRHVARRSFGTLVIDKKLIEVLGGTKGIIGILEAVAESIQSNRQKRRVA